MRLISVSTLIIAFALLTSCAKKDQHVSNYPGNPAQLTPNAFIQLPLGTIKAEGWLQDQLIAQKNGLTGNLDDFWPDLMNSSWRGGDGEAWERGPYYLDGLVPLAYLLDDQDLIKKVEHWMDFILNSGQENGWFGPEKNGDRWPLAVALKVLKSYYEGSGDERALDMIKAYFAYLHENAPDWPDNAWRGVRAMENAVTGYWLFRQTGDTTILNAIESIQNNCYSWFDNFRQFPWDSLAAEEDRIPKIWDATGLTAHVVNVAMAIKYPGIWSQQARDITHLNRSFEGMNKLDEHHGQVGGRFSGDEHLSGKNPTQGTEMCAIVEYMFSLENLIEVSGDISLADRLEELAFNSLPGTQTPDGWLHQYDQQANQVYVSNDKRDWSSNGNEANVFGVEPNFGCCTANMHQGWPKFTQSLWMATPNGGLAAISYAPCRVDALAGNQQSVTIEVQTLYPFEETISILLQTEKAAKFPIVLRIPAWCKDPALTINGEDRVVEPGSFIEIDQKWEKVNEITLSLPMNIDLEIRTNQAMAVKRGPLYFSLRIPKKFTEIDLGAHSHRYQGATDWKIEASGSWNYALVLNQDHPETSFEVITHAVGSLPFADKGEPYFDPVSETFKTWEQDAPLVLKAKGVILPGWQIVNNSAGPTPGSPVDLALIEPASFEEIELVPYANARLRISEFPVTFR